MGRLQAKWLRTESMLLPLERGTPGLRKRSSGLRSGGQPEPDAAPSFQESRVKGRSPQVLWGERNKIQLHSQAWLEFSRRFWEGENFPPSPSRTGEATAGIIL